MYAWWCSTQNNIANQRRTARRVQHWVVTWRWFAPVVVGRPIPRSRSSNMLHNGGAGAGIVTSWCDGSAYGVRPLLRCCSWEGMVVRAYGFYNDADMAAMLQSGAHSGGDVPPSLRFQMTMRRARRLLALGAEPATRVMMQTLTTSCGRGIPDLDSRQVRVVALSR